MSPAAARFTKGLSIKAARDPDPPGFGAILQSFDNEKDGKAMKVERMIPRRNAQAAPDCDYEHFRLLLNGTDANTEKSRRKPQHITQFRDIKQSIYLDHADIATYIFKLIFLFAQEPLFRAINRITIEIFMLIFSEEQRGRPLNVDELIRRTRASYWSVKMRVRWLIDNGLVVKRALPCNPARLSLVLSDVGKPPLVKLPDRAIAIIQ